MSNHTDSSISDNKEGGDVKKALQAAAKGVLFPSESDKPVKAFLWKVAEGAVAPAVDEAAVKAFAKVPEDATVTTVAVDTFFAPVVNEQEWFGAAEKERAERFRALVAALQQHLTDLRVFRVNTTGDDRSRVDAYVVGRAANGDLAGVSTQLIET